MILDKHFYSQISHLIGTWAHMFQSIDYWGRFTNEYVFARDIDSFPVRLSMERFDFMKRQLNLFMMSLNREDFSLEERFLKDIVHRTIVQREMFGQGCPTINSLVIASLVRFGKRNEISRPDKDNNFPIHLCCKCNGYRN